MPEEDPMVAVAEPSRPPLPPGQRIVVERKAAAQIAETEIVFD